MKQQGPKPQDWIDVASNPGPEAFRPFPNGSEGMSWEAANCDRCRRSLDCRDPGGVEGRDWRDYEKAVLEGQECGAKLCLDTSQLTGQVHPLVPMWMGADRRDRLPGLCQHRVTKPGWCPPPPPPPLEYDEARQLRIPYDALLLGIPLDKVLVTKFAIIEKDDV